MFTRLQLRQVKAWADSGPVALAPLTVLLGTNGSGKSALLESLVVLQQALQSAAGEGPLPPGRFEALVRRGAQPQELELQLDLRPSGGDLAGQPLALACRFGRDPDGVVVQQQLRLQASGGGLELRRQADGRYALWLDGEAQPRACSPELAPRQALLPPPAVQALLGAEAPWLEAAAAAIRWQLQQLQLLGPLRQLPPPHLAWSDGPRQPIGRDGQGAAAWLVASALEPGPQQGQLLQAVAHWLRRLELAEDLQLQPLAGGEGYGLLAVRGGVTAPLAEMGMGLNQVLPVLTLALGAPAGSTLLLEEPENHLHPLAQAVLAELLVEVSRRRGVQVLVETHSEHLFRRLQTLVAREHLSAEQCALVFVEAGPQGAQLRPLQLDAYGRVSHWPEHFFGDALGETAEQTRLMFQRQLQAGR